MKLKKHEKAALVTQDAPHIWEVKIPNHPNGVPQMHCGSRRDAERVLELYPDSTMTKIYLPHAPDTVNVQATDLGTDAQLNEGAPALPESQAEELNLS